MRRNIHEVISLHAVGYVKYLVPIIIAAKDWFWLLADYVGVTNSARTYQMRNGMKITTGDGISSGTIVVIFVKKDYGDPPAPDSTIIDIGANIGVYSLYACQGEGTRSFAFEPMKQNFEILKKNVAKNKLQDRIFPFHLAVSGKRETRKLYLGSSPLHSFLPIHESPFNAKFSGEERPQEQDFVEVDCIPLQEVFDVNTITRCDLLKIDCEGGEYDILYNLPTEYFSKIREIRMEYHNHLRNERNTGPVLLEFLQEQGFKVIRRKEGSPHQGDVWLRR